MRQAMDEGRVAVIGMGCRYAGAKNPEELWRILKNGEGKNVPMGFRFRQFQEYYHPDNQAAGKFYNNRAFFLKEDLSLFDADFFRISYKEAKRMDYQQRLLLQVSYEALLDAGMTINGSGAGVFIGAFMQDFLTNTMQKENYDKLYGHHATGSSIGMLAARLSYFYDIHGPSIAVDTACSSSLTALHLAAESIRRGDCQTALCGGVNIMTEIGNFITLSKGGFLSRRGISSAFGREADGYARGEGAGVLVLKELGQALRDNDSIYCEIIKTAINHDGNKKGVAYPNGEAQQRLLSHIYGEDGASIDDIGYLEAHGTGTQIGDRTETEALQSVFGKREKVLPIGSLKSNIGHTEAAAGIGSVIKSILILQHGEIPPTLHCEEKNPNIPFESYKIRPVETAEYIQPAKDGRRYIGINGFGFGGANAHAYLGSLPEDGKREGSGEGKAAEESGRILYLSANSELSLQNIASDYKYAIQGGKLKKEDLKEICRCTKQRRPHNLPFRLAVYAPDRLQLAKNLTEFEKGGKNNGWLCKQRNKSYKKQAAVFSGMGSQRESMGKDLYRNFPVFRERFCQCSREYEKYCDRSLKEVIESETIPDYFYRVSFLQPYHLAYQISLFALLLSEGVEFCGCVGHSAGELAAFCCSGMLTLEETFRIAWHRGSCQERLQGRGKMLAVRMSRKEAVMLCKESGGLVSLGVENGENRVVLSGDLQVLEEIKKQWGGKLLKGSVAYHSWQMDEVEEKFRQSLQERERNGDKQAQNVVECITEDIVVNAEAEIALYSTVYGELMEEGTYDAGYWWRNIRDTVEFSKTLKAMKRDGFDSFVEIGAAPVLMPFIAEEFYDRDFSCIAVSPGKGEEPEAECFYRAMMQAYVNRVPMHYRAKENKCRNLPLPGYRWDKKKLPVEIPDREWKEPDIFLGREAGLPLDIWKNRLNLASHDWLKGHKVEGEYYLPAVFYAAMLREAGIKEWENMEILRPVIMHPWRDTLFSFIHYPDKKEEIYVFSAAEGKWLPAMKAEEKSSDGGKNDNRGVKNERSITEEVLGKVRWANKLGEKVKGGFWKNPLGNLRDWQEGTEISKEAVYRILQEKSLHYEGCFCAIERALIGADEAFCQLTVKNSPLEKDMLVGVLDAMLQAAALAGSQDIAFDKKYIMLPVRMGKARLYDMDKKEYTKLYAHAAVREKEGIAWKADCRLYDENGGLLAEFLQVIFGRKEKAEVDETDTYTFKWEKISREEGAKGGRWQKPTIFFAGKDAEKDILELLTLVKEHLQKGHRIVVVTENAMKVLPEDRVSGYGQAGLWGLVRCIRAERPDMELYLIDMDYGNGNGKDFLPGGPEENKKVFSESLIRDDLPCLPEGELEMAYRNGNFYGLRVASVQKAEEDEERNMQGTTAILTGASGGLAFPYALWMAAAGAEKIALVSRNQSKNLGILLEVMDYYGLQGRLIKADVTDMEQMKRCWKQLEEDGWLQEGKQVFCHLAGYSQDCSYGKITPRILKKHLEPKMEGAKNLAELVKQSGGQLILIGSITAMLGNPGQGCYGAANSMLQAFAEYGGYRLEGFGALDTGMAVREERVSHALQRQGIGIMEGRKAVRCRKECGTDIGYTAKLDWQKVLGYRNMQKDKKFRLVKEEEESRDIFGEVYKEGNAEEKEKILQKLLQTIFAEVLGMGEDEVFLDRNTDTMGIDSLSATFIAGKIRQKTGSSITPSMTTGAFTIRDMAMRIYLERESAEPGERS